MSVVDIDPLWIRATTGHAPDLTRVLPSFTLTYMLILDRDRRIILSVGDFRQVPTAFISALHFSELSSDTPMYRALDRLVERKYLARLERRPVGGRGAGSGQYVYQLDREGQRLYGSERRWLYRAIDFHTLGIADAYLDVFQLEQAGRLEILAHSTEPNSHTVVGGVQLRPDLFLELGLIEQRRRAAYWLEVDMGTERQAKIRDKVADYLKALENATAHEVALISRVIFIAPDDRRARELRWLIAREDGDAHDLFRVAIASEWTGLLFE